MFILQSQEDQDEEQMDFVDPLGEDDEAGIDDARELNEVRQIKLSMQLDFGQQTISLELLSQIKSIYETSKDKLISESKKGT